MQPMMSLVGTTAALDPLRAPSVPFEFRRQPLRHPGASSA